MSRKAAWLIYCARCGYDLRGSRASSCPECGHPTARTVRTPPLRARRRMLHALIGGVICAVWSAASGFVGGVWGSLVHDPPSNLGPLVGFGTGPLGLLFGGVAGVIIGLCCKRLSRLVAAVVLASIAYGAVCWLVIAYSEY